MKLIFLDRDGVINKDLNTYVTTPADFEFLPGALEALTDLTNAGYEIVIVSNQAGVAKGLFSQSQLERVNASMIENIEQAKGRISRVEYCLHDENAGCSCRKPATGLFCRVLENKDVDLGEVYFIGDKESDIAAGRNIGCKTILVLSGKTKTAEIGHWQVKPDCVKSNLKEAVDWLLDKEAK